MSFFFMTDLSGRLEYVFENNINEVNKMSIDELIKQSKSMLLSKHKEIVNIKSIDDIYNTKSRIIFNYDDSDITLYLNNTPDQLKPENIATAVHALIKL